ncbi:MAG: methyltransferase domain-containing protein [Robiginitomaculum sp.]
MAALGIDVRYMGGAVTARQPKDGYRAGTDAILLAQSLNAKPGTKFLELGSGSGVVMLIADYLMPGCFFMGLERSADMLALSRENGQRHDNIESIEGSVRKIPHAWHLHYDQVFANPPFFDDPKAICMPDSKAPSFVNNLLTLADWIAAMLVTLKPRGIGTIIQRADRLEHILHALYGKAGRIKILPIHSYENGSAKRVIVQFRKGVASESILLAPLIMHVAGSKERYAPLAREILTGQTRLKL